MAEIKARGRIMGITKEGISKKGEAYLMFELSESFKSQNSNKYDYTYWHCYIQGEDRKKVKVDTIATIEGNVTGKQNIVNGRKYDNKTVFVNTIICNTFDKREQTKEDRVELPFD